jgi:hypothetical protein
VLDSVAINWRMRLAIRLRNATRALLGRAYEAGGSGPRWPAISAMAQPAQQALAQRALISQPAAWLTANAPLAESIVLNFQANLIADGPSVRSRHPDAAVRSALEGAWNNQFWNQADVEGGDLCQFLNRVTRCLVTNGEGPLKASESLAASSSKKLALTLRTEDSSSGATREVAAFRSFEFRI